MTDAGERAREIVYGCRMGDQWTDTELISRIADVLSALETENAESRRALDAADAFARCEHSMGCMAKCTCGAWEERNMARSEFYARYRSIG